MTSGQVPTPATEGGSARNRRPGRRRLAVLVLAGLAGAGCLAGAAALAWWVRDYHDPLTGTVAVQVTGSQVLGELIPMALVVLAGLGASIAARGLVRRAVGVLLALGGVLIGVRAAVACSDPPIDQLAGLLRRPATALGPADLVVAGPVLALAGAALLVLAGVLVATGADRTARRMGSAYDAPARRREQVLARAAERAAGREPDTGPADPAEWWRAIDAGADPTDVPAPSHGPDRTGADGAGGPAPTPGPEDPAGPDTIGPPDGPDNVTTGPRDRSHRAGRSDRTGRPRPRSDEETTG